MSDARERLLKKISEHILDMSRDKPEIREDSVLFDLGVDSMGMINMLLMLEKEFGLDFDRMIGSTPPKTVSDLLDVAEKAMPAEQA